MVPLLSLVLCDAEIVDNSFRVNVLAHKPETNNTHVRNK